MEKNHLHSLEGCDQAGSSELSVPDQLYFHTLSVNQVTKSATQAFLEVEVDLDHCKKPLLCKVDTGAEGNVISLSTYKSLFPQSSCSIPTCLLVAIKHYHHWFWWTCRWSSWHLHTQIGLWRLLQVVSFSCRGCRRSDHIRLTNL